jgi:dTDP-4-amino-4,6-dideoxygalactose transaminase
LTLLGALISQMRGLRARFPAIYDLARDIGTRFFSRRLGVYPRTLGNELYAVSRVLHSSKWNMAYGRDLTHERLEANFAEYTGASQAVAVNTGGMALQMSFRALNLRPGHEVLVQADTCSATAFAVMNAGCTPIFADISRDTFMLSADSAALWTGSATKAVIASHMWGNPEDMDMVSRFAADRKLIVIEDACLSLGAAFKGRMVGTSGRVGIFSFGCLKPIQGGEGGMIVTNDEALARELRSLRHWGDRTIDYGVRDTAQLSWNGRMSEIVAAVVNEQLRGYPAYLKELRRAAAEFARFLENIDGLNLVLGSATSVKDCAFTQVVIRIDESRIGCTKQAFRDALAAEGISTWHANFEPIPTLSFFKNDTWRDWILNGDIARVTANYHSAFPDCCTAYESTGLGVPKSYLSSALLGGLKSKIEKCLRNPRRTP